MLLKLLLLLSLMLSSIVADNSKIIREEFSDLNNWEHQTFEKIKNHSKYEIIKKDGRGVVKLTSNSSASGMLYKKEFNINELHKLSWSWRVDNVYENIDVTKKKGDDYPVRLYIVFKYDPQKASFVDKAIYGSLKLIYGKYPPHSSIAYVWSNKNEKDGFVINPYSKKARSVIKNIGVPKAGEWKSHSVNIIEDYKKIFGEEPPEIASIAFMNDSDNSKDSAVSYIDFIEVK